MVDASLGKHLKNLKSLLNRASQEGMLRDEAFKRYQVPKNDSDIPSLEASELDYLWSVLDSLDKPKMEVLLSFLFMCETAIRISEAKVITWHSIQGSFIDLYERKNDKRKRPFLTERSHQALNYFRQHGFERPLVIKSNFNTVLKEIFRELKLDREVEISRKVNLEMTTYLRPLYDVVCSKVARKTYVTLALSKNISPNYIQRTTGHSDPRILFKYNKLTDGMVVNFMANMKN
jgi:integrase